ncbi:High affinity cAMP-specific and IBMX-insensitive 3',5'-cyclic phosphodiesterase 9A [Entophlyctis sp. JEL0112]|nr:High affinity cAMP-specific and IBMX-insensitive 3',5'-cyclic phosphodiesterase 9A [Entophlyctis sp. JEL0112]
MSAAPTILHVKIDATNRFEIIEIAPGCTLDEIRSVFFAAAEIPELRPGVVLKLVDSSGCVIPIGHGIDANSKQEPYVLKVVGDRLSNFSMLQSAIDDIAQTSPPVSITDVQDLKQGIQALKKKLENVDIGVANSGKPGPNQTMPDISKPVSKPIVLNDHYKRQPKYILTEETKEYLRTPSFDNWAWDEYELFGLFEFMFEDLGLISEFSIDVETLRKFLIKVRDSYNNNPFHNFKHCFCVSQMMFGILHVSGVHQKLKPIDKLILLLSTIGHDLDHPGFNNAYQINAGTDLAIVYNDISPLENHHAAVLFTILASTETNVLASLSDAVYRDVRKNVIRCILATDMAKHGEIMAAFKKAADGGFNFDDAEQKSLLLQMIVKCSDISNEEPWVEALLNEFFTQSDTEKVQGLPTAPFMDRDKVTKAGAQVGFIGYVMIPLYELVAKVLPNMDKTVIAPIKESLSYYKDMLEKTPK